MSDKTVNFDKTAGQPAVEIKAPMRETRATDPEPPVIKEILEDVPADLFSKTPPPKPRPERVAICKAHIDAFSNTIKAGQTDTVAVETATIGMATMLELLETLNYTDIAEVLDYQMEVIVESLAAGKKAYDKGYVFIGMYSLANINTRNHFVRMLNLFITYAKLRDKSKLETKCSVGYSLEFVKSENGRKSINAYFTN